MLWLDQLRPAFDVAIADALAQFNIQFNVVWHTYMPCVSKVAWYCLNLLTKAAQSGVPGGLGQPYAAAGTKYDVFIGPPCWSDALQAGIVTNLYPTIYLTGSVTLLDTIAEFKNAVRCNLSSYSQWSIFLAMAKKYAWSSMALFYDDTDNTRSTWANSLMNRWTVVGNSYVQFALSALTTSILSLIKAAQLQARSEFRFAATQGNGKIKKTCV